MTTAENDNGRTPIADPFVDDWRYLTEPSDSIALDILRQATDEDPFATSRLADCLPFEGLTPSSLVRYQRASIAFLKACRERERDEEREEILRRIALYWLRKSKAYGVE
jgi:hypothetical protein